MQGRKISLGNELDNETLPRSAQSRIMIKADLNGQVGQSNKEDEEVLKRETQKNYNGKL